MNSTLDGLLKDELDNQWSWCQNWGVSGIITNKTLEGLLDRHEGW